MNQREKKFRAWDKEKKHWIGVGGKILHFIGDDYFSLVADIDIKLMQYTGLKDKNEKEIYEGDLVKIDSPTMKGDNGIIGEVVWNYASWQFKDGGLVANFDKDDLEIIGNRYERVLPKYKNPDILKECPKELKVFKKDTKLAKKQEEKSV